MRRRQLSMNGQTVPEWVPNGAKRYLEHTEKGLSIRELARKSQCHASTVLRQVRKFETLRDDPLVDEALTTLGQVHFGASPALMYKECVAMDGNNQETTAPSEATLAREGRRVLRRLCESGAVLAFAKEMEKAVVVREAEDGSSLRTAVVDRAVAQAMALKDWISCKEPGRISRYTITSAGRAALNRLMAEAENCAQGFADAQSPFAAQHQIPGEKLVQDEEGAAPRRVRFNAAESPLTALARRKDKFGKPFLSDDLVAAGERLREDFELAQMGPRVGQNWDRFLTGGERGSFAPDAHVGSGPDAARARVATALEDLGEGLSDVALRCCCYLEGLEQTEKRLGWSARSAKIVLRIALTRLRQHYRDGPGADGAYIG